MLDILIALLIAWIIFASIFGGYFIYHQNKQIDMLKTEIYWLMKEVNRIKRM